MRSKKLEPGLSVSPAGMAAAVGVAGLVRAEEGGAAVGEAEMEEEARVKVVEARAAMRWVTGERSGVTCRDGVALPWALRPTPPATAVAATATATLALECDVLLDAAPG